jgi:hypothetical protein
MRVLGPHLVAEGDEVPIGAAVTRVLDDAAVLARLAAEAAQDKPRKRNERRRRPPR